MVNGNFVPLASLKSLTGAEPAIAEFCTPKTLLPRVAPPSIAPPGEYYCRELKLLEFGGYSVLFDVERFRLFTVGEDILAFLSSIGALDSGPLWQPIPVLSNEGTRRPIEFLVRTGILSRESFPPSHENIPPVPMPTGLTLHVNHICNLRCVYCYADGGTYGGEPMTMSDKVLVRAIDLFLDVCHPERALIHWFGGEPLVSFTKIRFGTLYAKRRAAELGKAISFSMNSNGTVIDDEKAEFLAQHGFNITISCDGDPEMHDQLRPRADGKGSYGDLLKGLAVLRRHGVQYGLRATATRDRPNVFEQIRHLGSLGPTDGIEVEFDVQKTQHGDALTQEEAEQLRSGYRAVADRLMSGEDTSELQQYVGLRDVVTAIIAKKRKSRGCMAGTSSFAVHPEGHVFPCHRFVTDKRFALGNILEGFRFEVDQRFLNAILFNREPCSTCWARYLCGGACYNICSENFDDILKPPEFYCQNMMIKISEAIRMIWKAGSTAEDPRAAA
jgi:uncharacterized protein